ncbi:MAG: GIY-YIG nuclease family protein [Patescibacteria group bacterium]|nr:GIY-YIG nuclease family protein [Patescibacteria group bacterium]
MHYFYLFRCKDGSLYSGSTSDLKKREQAHNSGRGSKYVRAHGGGQIVYHEKFRSLSKALKREAQIKKWPRAKKLKLL